MGDFRRSVRDCIYGSPYVRKGCDVGDFRAVVTEQNRFHIFLMSELEMAARFSLKSVVLARMEILGIVHLLVLLFLIPVCARLHGTSVFQTGLYLLVPYLLTADAGLWAAWRTSV